MCRYQKQVVYRTYKSEELLFGYPKTLYRFCGFPENPEVLGQISAVFDDLERLDEARDRDQEFDIEIPSWEYSKTLE